MSANDGSLGAELKKNPLIEKEGVFQQSEGPIGGLGSNSMEYVAHKIGKQG